MKGEEQDMMCCNCGHMQEGAESYEEQELDGESVGVCPNCGGFQYQGDPSFAPRDAWSAEDARKIEWMNDHNRKVDQENAFQEHEYWQ